MVMDETGKSVPDILRRAVGSGTRDYVTALYGGILLGQIGVAENASYWETVAKLEETIQGGKIETLADLYKILITNPEE